MAILPVNSLLFMLMKSEGYRVGSQGNRNTIILHCFFVDDVELYAKNTHEKENLGMLIIFSKYMGLEFGQE